ITKIQNKQLIEEFESISIKESALNNYKNHVKGNSLQDSKLLINKLKRNFMCGKLVKSNGQVECRLYGNLFIKKDLETNEIFYIYNNKTLAKDANRFIINEDIKKVLNNYIGIGDK
ncbi:MAG: hypothetical protein ACRC7N_04915, partial [Clostridium sp.]